MMNDIENPLTLYSLNNLVHEAVSVALPARYWVTGELSEVREAANGHCYIELVQRDEATGTLVAKARGTIWSRVYSLLRPYFLEQTGNHFAQGLKVLLQVSVNFHELYGYTLDVCDIEPAYTIGDMARKRQLVIKRLADEGVIGLNKELQFPLLPQRVAVISSYTAAGYGDFCDQLHNNAYGFVFYTKLFPAPMQGNGVEQGIIGALDCIARNSELWDVVVIIRGGGAVSELSCFDTYELANNCAQFPLPIITGIGHERDDTVLDVVAHTRVKTPTAAAEFLIARLVDAADALNAQVEALAHVVNMRMRSEEQRLTQIAAQLPFLFSLAHTRQMHRIEQLESHLRTSLKQLMVKETHRLQLIEQVTESASPQLMLQRGYSITRCNGKVVRDASILSPGVLLTTEFADGMVQSEVRTPQN